MTERSKYEDLDITVETVMELAGPLADLVKQPGWLALRELLKGRRIQYREILTRAGKDAYDRIVGLVDGLEEAEQLPDTILQMAGRIQQREEIAQNAPPHRRRTIERDGEGSFS